MLPTECAALLPRLAPLHPCRGARPLRNGNVVDMRAPAEDEKMREEKQEQGRENDEEGTQTIDTKIYTM